MQLDDDNSDDAKSDASSELWEDEPDLDKQPQLDPVARLANKKADPAFGPLHRSKGFFWLATRPSMSGEWSQAGVMLSLSGGDKWLCEQDEETWPEHPECVSFPFLLLFLARALHLDFDAGTHRRLSECRSAVADQEHRHALGPTRPRAHASSFARRIRKKMKADFRGAWGDRRQELVFIGEELETIQPLLTAELDACLLNDDEWRQWKKVMKVRPLSLSLCTASRRH